MTTTIGGPRGPSEGAAPTDVRAALESLERAVLPPVRFAAQGNYARVGRLKGFASLVEGAATRAGLPTEFIDELKAVVRGFDDHSDDDKRAALERVVALVERGPRGMVAVPVSRQPPAAPIAPAPAAATPAKRAAPIAPRAARPTSTTTTTKTAPAPTPVVGNAPRAVGATSSLDAPLATLVGLGTTRAAALAERGMRTVGDVLSTLPRTYEDRRKRMTIGALRDGMPAVVTGRIIAAGAVGGRGRGRFELVVDDGTGQVRLVFFHYRQGEMLKRFPRDTVVTASGDVAKFGPRLQIVHPRIQEGEREESFVGLFPVYPEVQGLHPQEMARAARAALAHVRRQPIGEPLPADVVRAAQVIDLQTAFESIHAPGDDVDDDTLRALVERSSPGHRRLAFEELFVLATALSLRRSTRHVEHAPALPGDDVDALCALLLPFAPTGAQRRALGEILKDLDTESPMGRLLQGDVGAGKTAVAAVACLRAVRAGHQAAVMAPTEVLADQHARTFARLFAPKGIRVEKLTGSLTAKQRKLVLARLANRDIDIVVGTQALLTDDVIFKRLGLAVIDEQHRFGVVQRAKLKRKGPVGADGAPRTPHLLVMTATPIPRSLALTVYGDLSVSVLDELPPGRTPIATQVVSQRQVDVLHRELQTTLDAGARAFVVYPLIDESEKLDLATATEGFEALAQRFGRERTALLHGRMSTAERDEAMARFARGDVVILVSTTVIEVGVDVPDATLMVIQHAERFGMSQLHQLRGRVGRGARASRCLLVAGDAIGEDGEKRLRVLEGTTDGFIIAEEDLALRGPGDFLGTRQSGLPSLAFSDFVKHKDLVETSRALADAVVQRDPGLAQHPELRRLVDERYAERLALAAAG